MIQMKLIPDSGNPSRNILELKLKAPAAPAPTTPAALKMPTLIVIDDSIEQDQLPAITHALTDTINRVTWQGQIQLFTTKHQFPNHLEYKVVTPETLIDLANAQEPCNSILITNRESKDFKKELSSASKLLKSTYQFKPTTVIETIDALNDQIKGLKEKTIVNIQIEIELPTEDHELEPLTYIPNLTKTGNKYFANLIDLASEEEKAYAFNGLLSQATIRYEYEDLVLARKISGGQQQTL